MGFFFVTTMGWIFEIISLRENLINQSLNESSQYSMSTGHLSVYYQYSIHTMPQYRLVLDPQTPSTARYSNPWSSSFLWPPQYLIVKAITSDVVST